MNRNLSKPTNDNVDKKLVDMNVLDKYDELIKEFIEDKVDNHTCPVATETDAGLVKLSDEITVSEDGSLEVKNISISKIVSHEDEVVILGGLTATDL